MGGSSGDGRTAWTRFALGVGICGALTACGDDLSFGSAADNGQEFDTDTDAPDSTGADNDSAGASAGSSGTGGGAEDTDGEPTPEDSDDAIDECSLDCGDEAVCEIVGDQPQCVCVDLSQQWAGSSCIACSAVETANVDVDVPVVDAVFQVTLGLASFPSSPTEVGRIVLRSRDGLDEVEVGLTGRDEYTVTMVTGRYDAFYEFQTGGNQIPLNRSAFLGEIEVTDASPIALDVPRTLVDVEITLNGAPAPATPTNEGRIVLVDPSTGDETPLTRTSSPHRIAYVVPGTYDVHYRWINGSNSVPRNADAVVTTIEVAQSDAPVEIDIDIPFEEYAGEIFVNDAKAPTSPNESGVLTVVNGAADSDRFELGSTTQQQYAIKLIPGDYDVYYTHVSGGSTVPTNKWGYVQPLSLESPAIRIPSVSASGDITIGSMTPPDDGSNDGTLMLRTDGGDSVLLGSTRLGAYARRVIPGDYDVYYAQETAGGAVPVNTNARIQSITVTESGGEIPIDVKVVALSGTFTLNDELPPDSEYDDGRVYLRNRETGDSALLGNTRMGSFTKLVVPAMYDIVYVVESAGADLPINTEAVIRQGVMVDDGDALSVDIPAGRLKGSILLAGSEPMTTGSSIILQDVVSADEVFLGSLDVPDFNEALTAGRYLVRYRGGSEAFEAPRNTDAAFSCLDVAAGP